MDIFTVALFGHGFLNDPFSIEAVLDKQLRRLLGEKTYVEFLVGRNGEFDQLAASAILGVKKTYRDDNSSLCLILPYETAELMNNQKSFESYYDTIEVCAKASMAHPKAAIQIRNREMVDRADLIICYVESRSGGAYQTIRYAKTRGKEIVNLADIDRTR